MATTLKITNGFDTVNFLDESGYYLTEGGLMLSSPKYRGTESIPLVGVHGNAYKEIEYRNRKVKIDFSTYGTTYASLLQKIADLNVLINEANMGQPVALAYSLEDSSVGYLKVLSGSFEFPREIMSLSGVHWKDGDTYKLHNCSIDIETAPFFSDTFEGDDYSSVPYSVNDNIENDAADLSLTDLPGDILSDTILRFTGNYSDGLGNIRIGLGKHAFETTLDGGIDGSQTSITPANGFVNDLLVPFVITIDSEDLRVTQIGTTWTVERGHNSTTPASHSDGATITINKRLLFDADDSLSYCTTSVLKTGTITGVSINAAGTGYVVNTQVTVSGGNGDATLRVLEVDSSGVVQSLEIIDGGSGYSTASGVATSGGGNNDLTVDIDEVQSDTASVTVSTTDDLNSNYMDITMQGQGIRQLVKWTIDRTEVAVINQKARIIGRLAQTSAGWGDAVDYRVKFQYDSDSGYTNILSTTEWRTVDDTSTTLLDLGLINIPPTGSKRSASDISMILEARIKPEQVYDESLILQSYTIYLDFLRIMPVGGGFRYIKCANVPVGVSDRLLDDSRVGVPTVEEYVGAELVGEVAVYGLMAPLRTNPMKNGNSVHVIFESVGYSSSMDQTIPFYVYVIGNYIGMVD